MSDPICVIDDDSAKGSVYAALLTAAEEIKSDESSTATVAKLLADDVLTDRIGGYLTGEQAEWVAHEARYRIVCTLGVPVEGRQDPIVDAVIAALAIQPQDRQARALQVAAEQYCTQPTHYEDAEQEPCMICGEPVRTFLCPSCELSTPSPTTRRYGPMSLFDITELAGVVVEARRSMPESAAAGLLLDMLRFVKERRPDLAPEVWVRIIRDAETAS